MAFNEYKKKWKRMIGNICKGGCEKIKHKNTIEV